MSLSAAGGRVAALRELGDHKLELLIGTNQDLTQAPGVAPFDGDQSKYPRAHVGTDAAGKAVVVFPRCTTTGEGEKAIQTCDLFSYDVAAGRERLLPGIRRTGRSEYEGVLDHGALLYAASGARPSRNSTGLWYRPAGGKERRIALNPGWDLALRGSRIANVISDGEKTQGEEPCQNKTLVLRSTHGAPRLIARECFYVFADQRGLTSPSFVGDGLYWARTDATGPNLFRHDLRKHTVRDAQVGSYLFGFQATSATSGLALVLSDKRLGGENHFYAADIIVPVDPIQWKLRKLPVIKPVLHINPNPLA